MDGLVAQSENENKRLENADSAACVCLDVLFARQARIRRIIAGLGINRTDSDDIVQEITLKAINRIEPFESEAVAMSWLSRVAVNCCLNEHRRKKRFITAAKKIALRLNIASEPKEPDAKVIAADNERMSG